VHTKSILVRKVFSPIVRSCLNGLLGLNRALVEPCQTSCNRSGQLFTVRIFYNLVPQVLPLFHGTVAVAICEGALDELVELANTGRQQLRAAVPMQKSESGGELAKHDSCGLVDQTSASDAQYRVCCLPFQRQVFRS